MKEEKFKVINFIRNLVLNLDNLLDNFPRKDIELKNRIRTNSYDLLELAYTANMTANKEHRREILEKALAKVKIIDFLVNICYDKQIINSKKYVKFGNNIEDISKYLTGWLKSIQTQGTVVRAGFSWGYSECR